MTGTIASVRKGRHYEGEIDEGLIHDFHVKSSKGKGTHTAFCSLGTPTNVSIREGRELDEPSFIAEKSFKSAPLNSRVPVQSPTARRKGKQKAEDTFEKVPLDVQEALILEDLLFVLMVRFPQWSYSS